MRLRERDEHLDPVAERELDAVDRALAGGRVDPDLAAWAELVALLRDERPEPDQGWAAELDQRSAQGFRRGEGARASSRDFAARLREMAPRRIAAPAGALATLAIVVVVAVSTLDQGSTGTDSAADSGGDGLVGAAAPMSTTTAPESSAAESAPSGVTALDGDVRQSSADSATSEIAPGTDKRQIDRDVRLTLSTQPDQVRDVSDEVVSITRSLDGIVASSQVSEAGRGSSATLELTIPSRNLDAALDQLTDLAHVDSLNETTEDVTKPYVSAQDRLRDAEAERAQLLKALGNASTDAEAQALRLQIDDASRQISIARAIFENIARKARLSNVSVTIVADPNAPTDDSRSLGDWFDDAVDVLRAVAGVLLVSAAIVVPLGILVALAWWIGSRVRRAKRERVLDA